MKRGVRVVPLWLAWVVLASPGAAQELTPRAYWPAPRGTEVLVVGYAYSSGDVVLDPTIPVESVDNDVSSGLLAYLRTFSLADRTTNVIVELPYAWGSVSGDVQGQPATTDFSGFGDLGVTVSLNVLGAPSMTPQEFLALRSKPHPILGCSLKVVAPTGDHDADKLINVSANRWGFKPELGYMYPLRPKWLLEFDLGAWFFTANDEYALGARRQELILGGQIHLVKRFRPGRWVSLDVNHFDGGQLTVDGEEQPAGVRNSRIGVTYLHTMDRRHGVKLGLSTSINTDSGGDYQQLVLAYQQRLN